MDPASLLAGQSRETPIRRDADGRWYHEGDLLEHEKLTRAFDRWIERAEDGRWCLKNDINWAYFQLEGAPFFVRSVRCEGSQALLTLSNDEQVPLELDSLREGPDAALYCDAYPGLAARFDRSAAARLGELLLEDSVGPYFADGDRRVRPPQVDDPLREG
jgi:hypothetical protein